jgi:hypothetical protein
MSIKLPLIVIVLIKEIIDYRITGLVLMHHLRTEFQTSSSSAYECPHYWGTGLPYGLHIKRTDHNPPRGPSAGWWVVTTAITARTNGLMCLPKDGAVRDNNFFFRHHKPIKYNN